MKKMKFTKHQKKLAATLVGQPQGSAHWLDMSSDGGVQHPGRDIAASAPRLTILSLARMGAISVTSRDPIAECMKIKIESTQVLTQMSS